MASLCLCDASLIMINRLNVITSTDAAQNSSALSVNVMIEVYTVEYTVRKPVECDTALGSDLTGIS